MTVQTQKQKERVSICMDNTLEVLAQREPEELFYSVSAADLLKLPHCPVCMSENRLVISEVSKEGLSFFETSTCNECAHVWRSISPGCRWFQQRWKQIATGKLEVFNPKLEQDRLGRYRQYYTLLSRFMRKGKLLDVGAAYGSGVDFFRRRGFDVQAVEVEDDRAHYILEQLGIKVHHSALEDLNLAREQFDVILFAHCLEHLDDPRAMLQKLAGWVNPERGLIYLEIPILWTMVDWRDAFFMAHKHNFTEEGVERMARECGLRVVEKFLVPDEESDIDNFGMLLTKSDVYPALKQPTLLPGKGGAKGAAAMYRHNMPFAGSLDANEPLHYDVPYINHFYYIVRMQQGEIRSAQGANRFTFVRTAQP